MIARAVARRHPATLRIRAPVACAVILGGVTTIRIMVRSLEDSYFLHLPGRRSMPIQNNSGLPRPPEPRHRRLEP